MGASRNRFTCYAETSDLGHGWKEVRRLWASEDLAWLARRLDWAGLRSLVMTESARHVGSEVTRQRRYFTAAYRPRAMATPSGC